MKVFLTGATGYIGSTVAQALKDADHEVIGLARTPQAETRLTQKGYQAIRGDLRQPAKFAALLKNVDAVIHTGSTNDATAGETDLAAVEAMLKALEGSDKPFVYTSGVWVLGDTGGRMADEKSPIQPTPLVAWRPAVEKLVTEAAKKKIRAVVIRPALVYGRGGGIPAMLTESAKKGEVRYIGTGDNYWPFIHVDALADLYVRAIEKAPAGSLYNAAQEPAVRVRDVARAVALAANVRGIVSWPLEEARKSLGLLADALAISQQISGDKAQVELGWRPEAPSILEDLRSGSYRKKTASRA